MIAPTQTALHLTWSCCCFFRPGGVEAVPAAGAAHARESQSGWTRISPILVFLIVGKNYGRLPVRTERLTLKIIKHFTLEVNWCYPCFAAGEN